MNPAVAAVKSDQLKGDSTGIKGNMTRFDGGIGKMASAASKPAHLHLLLFLLILTPQRSFSSSAERFMDPVTAAALAKMASDALKQHQARNDPAGPESQVDRALDLDREGEKEGHEHVRHDDLEHHGEARNDPEHHEEGKARHDDPQHHGEARHDDEHHEEGKARYDYPEHHEEARHDDELHDEPKVRHDDPKDHGELRHDDEHHEEGKARHDDPEHHEEGKARHDDEHHEEGKVRHEAHDGDKLPGTETILRPYSFGS